MAYLLTQIGYLQILKTDLIITDLAGKDHDLLDGLADDDHAQYLLAAGSRILSADWDIGDGRKILADAIWARDTDWLTLYDDDGDTYLQIQDGLVYISGQLQVKGPGGGVLTLMGEEGQSATLIFYADEGDDDADKMRLNVSDGGDLDIESKSTGSWVKLLTLGPAGVSGTAVKDEDDMVSDSDIHLATQQSIKAYVDAGGGGAAAYAPKYKFNLKIVPGTTPAAQVTVTADELVVSNVGGDTVLLTAVSEADIDITSAGLQGLDDGSEAASTMYYIWIIYDGSTVAGLLSLSDSAPTMPGGYTYKRLVGEIYNDSGSNFDQRYRVDDWVWLTDHYNIFTGHTLTTSWVSHSLPASIPSNIVMGQISTASTASSHRNLVMLAPFSDGGGGNMLDAYLHSYKAGPTGGWYERSVLMFVTGGAIYAQCLQTASYANQQCSINGYKLPR